MWAPNGYKLRGYPARWRSHAHGASALSDGLGRELQIERPQACVLGDTRKHFRTDLFAVFQALGQDAKRQDFGLGHGFVGGRPVRKHARQLRHFGQPTAIFFKFTFNIEVHDTPLKLDA